MTDRELLELAAKTAGYEVLSYDPTPGEIVCCSADRGTFIWSPLADDGDALRLAVDLELDVIPSGYLIDGEPYVLVQYARNETSEPQGKDSYAATRRAIVRAAAEIGRAVP